MGAMLFGGTEIERIQFNEISLWTGDRMAVAGRVLGESEEEESQRLVVPGAQFADSPPLAVPL